MKQQLDLTKEEAIKYYNSSNDKGFKDLLESKFGKDFYKQDITDIVYNLSSLQNHLDYNPLIFPNPSNKFEKYINACSLLAKVAEVYNEKQVVTWNGNNYHYIPYKYFHLGGSARVGVSHCWHFDLFASGYLYYNESIKSEKSYNNFKEYWEDYWAN